MNSIRKMRYETIKRWAGYILIAAIIIAFVAVVWRALSGSTDNIEWLNKPVSKMTTEDRFVHRSHLFVAV